MKRLLLMMMALVLSIPIWAGEKTVTISRNEGIYDDGTGVYYCTKGGITMTFSSGLNNVNYLVEHQQVVFDIFSTNYVIKKIKFNCLDNTTDDNLDCFYWGPSTISEFTGAPYVPTGSYTWSGYIGTWVGGSTPSKYVKFVTEAKPVRFGSVEITYDKEFGDIYEKVTTNAEIQDGQTYVLVSQNASKALGKEDYYGSDNLTTFTSTPVTLLDNNNKVKVTDEVQLMKLEASGNSSRPWYIKVGDNYMRRRSSLSGSSSGAAYGQGYNLLSASTVTSYEEYFRVSISVSGNTNNNALIRFEHNSTETSGGKTFAIRHYNGGSLFRDMDYSSNNQYAANQRVYLYKPAQSYEVTTECIPANGGYITLGDGILTDNQGRNWSQHFDNVTFFVGPTNGWGVGEVTLTDINSKAVTVLQPTNTSDFGNDYSFEMPANDVKITANFLQPYNIDTICNPTGGGAFNFISGYTDFNGQHKSNEGKTVTFKPAAADGYIFNSVTYYDSATGQTTTLTPDANGVYSFVMPGNDVVLTANFEEAHDLYLLGTANGETVWHPYGPKFTFDGENQVYYIDVYFKGNVSTSDPNGHFSLTKKIPESGSENPWGDIWAHRLVADWDGQPVQDGSSNVHLYPTSERSADNAFSIPAGVYRIEVNPEMTQMSISKYPLTVTFDPVSGSLVEIGQVVTASSNLDELVHAINPNEENAQFYNTTNNWATQENDNTAVLNNEGTTTVIANANIGYIHVENNATYEIISPLYLLGTANGETAWHTYGPKFTYDPDDEEYYIDVYFKGTNVNAADEGYGYFNLTTRIDMNDNWDNINPYRLGAEVNNFSLTETIIINNDFELFNDTEYQSNSFKIVPGVYRIHVYKERDYMYVTKYPLTITFDPESDSEVTPGTVVTVSSNLNELVHAINPNEDDATFQTRDHDEEIENPWVDGNTYTITEPGWTYFDAKSFIGYIDVHSTVRYYIPELSYTITKVVLPPELSSQGSINCTLESAPVGTRVLFHVFCQPGYQIDNVEVVKDLNGEILEIEQTSDQVYEFYMPAFNVTIYLEISKKEEPPVEPTTLAYIEREDTFEDGAKVIVADELIGVWMAKQYVWAKDQATSNYFLNRVDGTIDFIRERMKREGINWQPREWDQSNWVMLDFGQIDEFKNWKTDPAVYQAMRAQMERFVDNTIMPGTIKGTYKCCGVSINNDAYIEDPNQFKIKCQHVIVLSEVPNCENEPTGLSENSLGYPGYHEDPLETKYFSDHPERYMYNHYMPYNFWTSNTVTGGVSPSQESINHYNLNPNDRYFFMAPKDQEVAHVWAVWVGEKTFIDPIDPEGDRMTKDVFATYRYSPADDVNKYGFHGAFYVQHWDFNRLYDENGAEIYGKPGEHNDPELSVDQAYMFHIAIQYPGYEVFIPQAPVVPVEPVAPMARKPEATNDDPGIYKVYPLDMMGSSQTTTAVNELNSRDAVTIESMTYYNMLGQASDKPFDGINIIVVRYTDGSSRSWKVLR